MAINKREEDLFHILQHCKQLHNAYLTYFDFNNLHKCRTQKARNDSDLAFPTNKALDLLWSSEWAVWLNNTGKICYRSSPFEKIVTVSFEEMKSILHNRFNISFKKTRNLPSDQQMILYFHDLVLITGEEFNPSKMEEFYSTSYKTYHRNTFIPTMYMIKQYIIPYNLTDSVIIKYIFHLSNENVAKFQYIINWLAFFIQTLQKSSVALVLIGDQDSGIDILYDKIIKPLFGAQYCITLYEEDLSTSDLDKAVEDKIFYNLNEFSSESLDNRFLHGLITSNATTFKQKNKSVSKEIKIHGQTLITSSKLLQLDNTNLQQNCTLFKLDLKLTNFLEQNHLHNVDHLEQMIQEDLYNFAFFLRSYKINPKNAQLTFQDDDKSKMIVIQESNLEKFVKALKANDISYFNKLKNNVVYKELHANFQKNRVKQSQLLMYYNILYGDSEFNTIRGLMKELRKIDPKLFAIQNIHISNGVKYFPIKHT
ncbi:MAG: hypothetical protein PHX13_07815 [Thiovulaceae bacterium]|nr:hypothetical protein [Sulfurimonadaceae bacterium]